MKYHRMLLFLSYAVVWPNAQVWINYFALKNSGKWKFSTPLQILQAVRRSGGMHKNALFKGCRSLVAMVTTAACSRSGASFSYKNVAKKEWNVYFSISGLFGATDGNFMEKYSVTPSWQRTCLWQTTGVRIVSCRSTDFNMF